MLTISNNFAGTPVTKIDKDDGQIAVLKGFTQKEFDTLLGFKVEEKPAEASAKVGVTSDGGKKVEEKKEDMKPVESAAKPEEVKKEVQPTPADSTVKDPMADVLNTLQAQAAAPEVPPVQPPVQPPIVPEVPMAPVTPAMPTIPDPQL